MKSSCFLALLFILPIASYGAAYQWTDADGQVHFSQTPPPNQDAKEIPLPSYPQPAPQPTTPQTGPNQSTPNSMQEKAQSITNQIEDKKEREKIEAENKKRLEEYATNCERAKKYLNELNSKVRIRLTDLQGNMRILTPDEKQQQIETTERAVKFYCNPPALDTGHLN